LRQFVYLLSNGDSNCVFDIKPLHTYSVMEVATIALIKPGYLLAIYILIFIIFLLFINLCCMVFIRATLPCPPLSFVLAGDMAISTHAPPCEQWLASMGAGAGLSFGLPFPASALPCPPCWVVVHCVVFQIRAIGAGAGPSSPLCLLTSCCLSTRDPPHEQLLMRLGAGGVSGWCGLSRTGFHH